MSTLKAIETRYKGYRFRSRLEARWAVFFDALKLKWQYEPQGYLLDSIPYLPDFYLPTLRTWVEIKASGKDTKEDWKLCELLSEGTGDNVIMAFDDLTPMLHKSEIEGGHFRGWYTLNGKTFFNDGCWCFSQCPKCYMIGVGFHGFHDNGPNKACNCICETPHLIEHKYSVGPDPEFDCYYSETRSYRTGKHCGLCERAVSNIDYADKSRWSNEGRAGLSYPQHFTVLQTDSLAICKAFEKARSARFEHGETPNVA